MCSIMRHDLIVNRKFNILLDTFRGSGMNGA